MNILKKIHRSAKLRKIKSQRAELQRKMKALGKKYQATFKKEARRLRKRG